MKHANLINELFTASAEAEATVEIVFASLCAAYAASAQDNQRIKQLVLLWAPRAMYTCLLAPINGRNHSKQSTIHVNVYYSIVADEHCTVQSLLYTVLYRLFRPKSIHFAMLVSALCFQLLYCMCIYSCPNVLYTYTLAVCIKVQV